ncbi:acyltransferase family protein [Microbacterium sp. C7(2022)]|uniref:acyltransferase family protein n=1 Tax=Microbacterium sp. C7(2022) TaxID=2992759 RepID=UPI00237AAF28|nr:acyltransferase family protein [Microbacterium sp. C7(2022)]MDE0547319.1 acyltransferase [Microbacterium sp. C7(2022)]
MAATTLPPRRAGFIAEIEGVRGLALTLVVLFHLFGQGRVSGGVDVFLLISGFLLTRSIVRKAEDRSGPFLTAQYGRVLLRLVPSALVVLIFTVGATLVISPLSTWAQTGREVIASALYYENWELISSQLSYGAAGPNTSPLQHFWSLSVQGQFFFFWPLAVVGLAWLAFRAGQSVRPWVLAFASITTAGSFVYAMILTQLDQPVAYFSSFSRFWELGAGALLALMPALALPALARMVLGWVGLLLIVSCGFVIDGAHAFPGPWTLWPLIGIALIILGSGAATRWGPDRVLQWRPLTFLARVSYPLYLWHWPILIFYIQFRHQEKVGIAGATVVFLTSLAAAWLTQRWVAEPVLTRGLKYPSPRVIAVTCSALLVVSLTTAAAVWRIDEAQAEALAAANAPSPDHPGALALTTPAMTWDESVPFRPSAETANADLPPIYDQGCVQNWRSEPGMDEVLICPDESTDSPAKTIVMSGGSHVLHWYPALRAIADELNWAVVVVDKDGCRLTTRTEDADGLSETCHRWNDEAIPTIIDLHPDAVFTVATKTPEEPGAVEIAYPGQVAAWAELQAAGVPVIAVRDTPRFFDRVPECIELSGGDPAECGRNRDDIFAPVSPVEFESVPDGTALPDLTDAFCTPQVCEAVVGNVLVYRDQDHMTATYSATLATPLRDALESTAAWLFE